MDKTTSQQYAETLRRRREYRRQDREALLYLRTRVKALTMALQHEASFPSTATTLPWQDVAAALEEATAESLRASKELKSQLRYYNALARRLTEWVGRHVVRDTLSPDTSIWQDNYLPLDASTRKLGLEWMRQRQLHQVDLALQRAGFPVTHEPYCTLRAIPQEDKSLTCYLSYQRVIPASLEFLTAHLMSQVKVLDTTTALVASPGLIYSRRESSEENNVGLRYPINGLACFDISPSRCTGVYVTITDDELYPNEVAFTKWTACIVGTRLGPNETLVQEVVVRDGLRSAQTREYIPLNDCYRGHEIMTTHDEQVEHFERVGQHRLNRQFLANPTALRFIL